MVSLANVLNWLTQPKGPHLVDGASTQDSLTALAILVTPEVLHDSDSPRVGLGLVYKAQYMQTASFSEAFFFLKLASQDKSSNRTTNAQIIFVQIQESSQVIPLPGVPTLFLDVKTAEGITDSNKPRSPQDFRGFKLHRVVNLGESPPMGQVAFPHLRGTITSFWAFKQRQVLTPELGETPELSVALAAADSDHWNIANDPIFPSCLDKFKVRHEVSQASGATRLAGRPSSQGGSSTSTHEPFVPAQPQPPSTPTLGWQEVDQKVAEVMDQLHSLHLETVQEMGLIWSVDQALAKSLMVEFLRLQLLAGDNLSTTSWTWYTDMEATTEKLLRDLDSATQTSTDPSPWNLPSKNASVQATLHKYQEVAKLKLALPLTHLHSAREEREKFMQFCLEELQSQQETRNLIGELSSRISDHRGRVCQVLQGEPLRHPEVAQLVMVGMAADRPLESNFFPGLLEGLLGRLGIAAPGESKPPSSSREGAGLLWASAMREAILRTEGRDVNTPGSTGLPQCLNLNPEEDFLEKRHHQVSPLFSDPLFIPNMASAVYKVFKPPVVLMAYPFTYSPKAPPILNQPEDGEPRPEVSEPMESTPSASKTSQGVQEQVIEAPDTDLDKADELVPEKESPSRHLKVKIPRTLRKLGNKATTSSSEGGATPSKVWKESEADDSETTASTSPSEAALQTARFKLYNKDLSVVKEIHARILGLQKERRPPKRILIPHRTSD